MSLMALAYVGLSSAASDPLTVITAIAGGQAPAQAILADHTPFAAPGSVAPFPSIDSSETACLANDSIALCLPTGTYDFGKGSVVGMDGYFDLNYAVYLVMPAGASLSLIGAAEEGVTVGQTSTYTKNITDTQNTNGDGTINADLKSRIDWSGSTNKYAQIFVQAGTPPSVCVFELANFHGQFDCFRAQDGVGVGYTANADQVSITSFAVFGGASVTIAWQSGDGSTQTATSAKDVPDVHTLLNVQNGNLVSFNITMPSTPPVSNQ